MTALSYIRSKDDTAQIAVQMMSLLSRKIERGPEDHNVRDHNV